MPPGDLSDEDVDATVGAVQAALEEALDLQVPLKTVRDLVRLAKRHTTSQGALEREYEKLERVHAKDELRELVKDALEETIDPLAGAALEQGDALDRIVELLHVLLKRVDTAARLPERALRARSSKIRVLVLSSSPEQTRLGGLPIDAEQRVLRSQGAFDVRTRPQITLTQLEPLLRNFRPQVLHFGGHQSQTGEIQFMDEQGCARSADMNGVARVFEVHGSSVKCVVLSACYSTEQAECIAAHVDVVIGISAELDAKDAIGFSKEFYEALGAQQSVGQAFALAKRRVALVDSGGEVLRLHTREGVDADSVFVRPEILGSKEVIDFAAERGRHEHFFGREDILAEIDEQLRTRASGWVLVIGRPGLGKSALLEQWLTRREQAGRLTAFHFIRRGHQNWAEPEAVRANLAAQIEQMFPEQRDLDTQPQIRLEKLLSRVGRLLEKSGQKLVLVVDGIDEAMAIGKENPIPEIFPLEVPAGVFVVAASRPKYPHLHWFGRRTGAVCPIDLDTRSESNEATVAAYWAVLGPKMEPPLAPELERAAVVAANGNLLHAVKLRELWTRPGVMRSVERVPDGFEGMLEELWERLGKLPKPARAVAKQGLALVCAARESLPLHVIEELLGWDEGGGEDEFLPHVREMLLEERWHEYPAYRPFHEGLRELVERKLPQSAKRNHGRLTAYSAWPLEGDMFRQCYALRHRIGHQVEAGLLDEATATCCHVGYLTAKVCNEGAGLLEVEWDLRLVATTQGPKEAQRLRTLGLVVGACSHWARRFPEALPTLLHDRMLTNAPDLLGDLVWPTHLHSAFPRLRHPLQKRGLSRVLEGHQEGVTSVAVLPDGRIVSGSRDKTLRVWNVETGAALATLRGCKSEVTCVAVMPDGSVVCGADDGALRVWDIETGTVRITLATNGYHDRGIRSVAVLSDGCILSGAADGTVRVWDVESGAALVTLKNPDSSVEYVAGLPDGRIVSGSYQALRVWDVKTGAILLTLEGHRDWVHSVAVLPDGRLVSGAGDGAVRVWDVATGAALATFESSRIFVSSVAVLPDGRIVSGSFDKTLRVWDIETGANVAILEGHQNGVSSVAVLHDGRIVSGSLDGTLRVWDIEAVATPPADEGHQGFVSSVAMLPDGRIVSGSDDNTLQVWDVETGIAVAALRGHRSSVTSVLLLPDGRIVSTSGDKSLRVWNAETGAAVATLEGIGEEFTCTGVLPDGRIVSGSFDKTLRVWDLNVGAAVAHLAGHHDSVSCVAVLPDGRIVSGSRDNTLRVWDLETRTALITLEGHQDRVSCVAVLPDGRIVSGSEDCTLRVWNAETGAALTTLYGHRDGIRFVVVLLDGRVVSGSWDKTLRVWDVETGAALATLSGHDDWVTCVALLPDGRIVSGSRDNTLRVWDLKAGTALAVFGDATPFCVVALDSQLVVAGDAIGNLWFVDLEPRG